MKKKNSLLPLISISTLLTFSVFAIFAVVSLSCKKQASAPASISGKNNNGNIGKPLNYAPVNTSDGYMFQIGLNIGKKPGNLTNDCINHIARLCWYMNIAAPNPKIEPGSLWGSVAIEDEHLFCSFKKSLISPIDLEQQFSTDVWVVDSPFTIETYASPNAEPAEYTVAIGNYPVYETDSTYYIWFNKSY